MDLALVSEFTDEHQIFHAVEGGGDSFEIWPGSTIPLQHGYCWPMTRGDLPGVVPDVRAEPRTRDLPLTAQSGVGSYVGVPMVLGDGGVYGTLSCLSHRANPNLGNDDVRFLGVAARFLTNEIERLETIRHRRRQAVRIKRLIQDRGMNMVFQPIFDLAASEPVGFEALARFRRRAEPARWFAEAAEAGMGPSLELMAVRLALQALGSLPARTYLSINLSPRSLGSPGLGEALDGVEGQRVVFELTEHVGVQHYGLLDRELRPFRDQGIRLAIDDVGAGFATLRHVLRMSPEILKLDVSLITHIDADAVRRALVASLVNFADRVGTSLIAEGIATGRELEVVRELGVPYGQGYFLGRPKPVRSLQEPVA
jgi:EAL domain-containing protein (putative c-di-GMP-specific phosphodiesterase class I)